MKTGPLIDGLRVVREGLTRDDWVVVGGHAARAAGLKVDPQQRTIQRRARRTDARRRRARLRRRRPRRDRP